MISVNSLLQITVRAVVIGCKLHPVKIIKTLTRRRYTVLHSLFTNNLIRGDLAMLLSGMAWRYHRTDPQVEQQWVMGTFLKRPQQSNNGWYYVNSAVGTKNQMVVLEREPKHVLMSGTSLINILFYKLATKCIIQTNKGLSSSLAHTYWKSLSPLVYSFPSTFTFTIVSACVRFLRTWITSSGIRISLRTIPDTKAVGCGLLDILSVDGD